MKDMARADYWLNNVLQSDTPLDICEKGFENYNRKTKGRLNKPSR